MAKELPYFKFEPNQWENGNIQMVNRELKGLFIDLCSMYWSRLGDLPLKLAVQKLCGGNATALELLCADEIIAVIDDHIRIDFLEEQLFEFKNISSTNSKNAKDGWAKRRNSKASSGSDATASDPQSETDGIREEERREEEKRREEKKKEDQAKKDSKIKKSNDFNYDFINPIFKESFEKWLLYKKGKKSFYSNQMSLEGSYKNLLKLSENQASKALEIVNYTIAHDWSGLQALKPQFGSGKKQISTEYKESEIWGQQ